MKFVKPLVLILLIGIIVWIVYVSNGPSIGNLIHLDSTGVIFKTDWQVVQQAEEGKIVRVEWNEKYGGHMSAHCRALFESKTQYKLVAPWINAVLEKSNINNITYCKENMDTTKKTY